MSEPRVTESLCRCCLTKGHFKSMEVRHELHGKEESYSVILHETFDVILLQPLINTDLSICDACELRLQDAALFKRQVLESEEWFHQHLGLKTDQKEVKMEIGSFTERSKSLDLFTKTSEDIDDLPLCTLKASLESQASIEPDWTQSYSDEDSNILKKTKKFRCDYCEKQFSYNGSLEMHLKIHTGEKPYICLICAESFHTNKDLTKHFAAKHSDGTKYPCTICPKVLDKPKLLKNHLNTHFEKKFKCTECQKEFQRKKGLKEHMKVHTGERKYQCEVCNKSFGHNQTLKSHMYTHTGEKPYICDICGRGFPQRTHLKRHIFIIHNKIKEHSCGVCKKEFSSKSYLAIHSRQHTGEKPYNCEVCKKDFTAYTTLKVHMRVHTGLKPYTCSFCGRRFTQMASFKLHQRTHTGEKPYSCKICRKSFSDNGYLRIHMRVHSGEKPFSCNICSRCFRENGQLKRHMRVHTGIKAYTCKICNKQIGNLSKHMKIHNDNGLYSCGVCSKQFSVNGSLKIHMKIHNKHNFCDVCCVEKRLKCVHKDLGVEKSNEFNE